MAGQAGLALGDPHHPLYPTPVSSAAQQSVSYLPFQQQQQQQLAHQLASQPARYAQGSAQLAAYRAHGQSEMQQHSQPGFTPAAGFKLPLSLPQECRAPDPNAMDVQTHADAKPSCQPGTADTAPQRAAGQQAVQTQEGIAGGQRREVTTSDILGQRAHQWRQAASKRSALADLVPTADKAAGMQQTRQGAPASAGGFPQMQPNAAQQGCAAFKPAVQACIAAAGLPLAKPFYQQALEHAMGQHTQQKALPVGQQSSQLDTVKQEAMDAQALVHSDQEAAGPADSNGHDADATGQHQHAAQQDTLPQQQQPAQRSASPTPSSNSDLGTDLPEEEAKRTARKHISAESWNSALICGELQFKQVFVCIAFERSLWSRLPMLRLA
ncbi:hypothetical protein ABBQ32_006705 [Trebouxia sp. C0010 RCD-2024]